MKKEMLKTINQIMFITVQPILKIVLVLKTKDKGLS